MPIYVPRELAARLASGVRSHTPSILFEGAINDSAALAQCLRGANVVFPHVALNGSMPGQSVALDTAKAIVPALRLIQQDALTEYRAPTVIILSSASLNLAFSRRVPVLVKFILNTALSNAYDDLGCKEAFYKSLAQNDLCNVIFARPPAIMPGNVRTGYALRTMRTSLVVSYADLSAGIVEMTEMRDEFVGKVLSLNAMGKVRQEWGRNLRALAIGLLAYLFLGAWWARRRGG